MCAWPMYRYSTEACVLAVCASLQQQVKLFFFQFSKKHRPWCFRWFRSLYLRNHKLNQGAKTGYGEPFGSSTSVLWRSRAQVPGVKYEEEEKFRSHDGWSKALQGFRRFFSATGETLRTGATAPTLHLHGRGLVEPAACPRSQREAFERGLNVRNAGWLLSTGFRTPTCTDRPTWGRGVLLLKERSATGHRDT